MGNIVSNFGLGKFVDGSHPIHPATVHFPIAFLITSSVLDIISAIGLKSPTALYPLVKLTTSSAFPNRLDEIALLNYLALFSYASTIAAIVTALPTLATGVFELYTIVQAKGLDLSNTVVKTTLIHAGLNDAALAGAFYNWLSRRNRTGYEVQSGNVVASTLILGGVAYSAYLGGSLVYAHGVGVQRTGVVPKEKKKTTRETKKQGKREL